MKKYEKGVTLIQTVIAVVMMVLIAAFAIMNSRDTAIETKIAKVYNEIVTVKNAVREFEILEENGMEIFSGDRLLNLDKYPELPFKDKENGEYYYLDFNNKGNILQDVLEIRNVENDYIVNVKNIDDIEIFLVDGIKVNNEMLYEDDQILEEYNNIFGGR